jgi:hypothetical protein
VATRRQLLVWIEEAAKAQMGVQRG